MIKWVLVCTIEFIAVLLVSSSSSTGGHHDVNPPSKQLTLHQNVYKPPEFTMEHEILGRKTVLISFNYTKIDLYDRYMFRIRYHGFDEYATSLAPLNRSHENSLKMRDMLDANYIICVSLFSSIRSNKYPPISSTGMCVDFTIGDSHPVGGSHSSTGLLAPLLLAVAAVILIFIALVNYFKKKKWINMLRKRAERLQFVKRAQEMLKTKRNSEKFSSFVAIDMDVSSKEKSVKWQTLDDESSSKDKSAFYNPAFINDDLSSESTSKDIYEHEGALSSIKTLSHLLDDKPWILRSSATPKFFSNNLPKGFY